MEALNSQVTKALIKQRSKEMTEDPVAISELLILQLKDAVTSLTTKVQAYESQYSTVAKVKLERRLKDGVDGRRAEDYRQQVEKSSTKKENAETVWDAKIEALETKKQAAISDFDQKISLMKAKKEAEIKATDSTIQYFTGLLTKYYEDVIPEPTVQYPPAYYKHVKDLEDANRQLKSAEHQLLVVKASGYTPAKTKVDIQREKERARIIAEEKADAIEAEARQKEEEGRINLERKAAFKAEEERRKQKSAVNTLIVSVPKEDSKKAAIRLEQLKATEEYRSLHGIRDIDCEISDSSSVEDDKDEDLLEDYKWAKEKGLSVPEGILQKLKNRKLI